MTTFEKLKIKIKKDIGIDVENMKRHYVGVHMKASGAFCWLSNEVGSKYEIGSSIPASELLKANKLIMIKGFTFGQMEIIPE